ncbi:hypothetical protein GOODEAATRI_027716 [Goodea atripinnis]|uniref:Uncharacterized protein n=1 Tax=Goodea atripinnis TaxID=208336 RepID=A0ABV0NGG8_9TELE
MSTFPGHQSALLGRWSYTTAAPDGSAQRIFLQINWNRRCCLQDGEARGVASPCVYQFGFIQPMITSLPPSNTRNPGSHKLYEVLVSHFHRNFYKFNNQQMKCVTQKKN